MLYGGRMYLEVDKFMTVFFVAEIYTCLLQIFNFTHLKIKKKGNYSQTKL